MNRKPHSKLWLYFAGVVFVTVCAVFLLVTTLWLVMFRFNIIAVDPRERHAPIILFALGSLLIGTVIALYVGKTIVRPVQNIEKAFDELSKGNFDVRVPEKGKIREIREMARHFNSMAYELSHIETLRNDFVADVSHEFKTPIAAIEGYAMLLQNDKLPREKQERYVDIILDNSHRLSTLAGNILMLSKLENRETIPDMTEYRLDEQIRQCVLMLENKWVSKQIKFDIELPKKMYYGSRSFSEQVWENILDNAVKYSHIGGCIRIKMFNVNGKIYVSIADDGIGMTDEVKKHIFEKFYQGDPSRKSDGNGLGLAMVKRIIDLFEGNIKVNSEFGKGSEFVVELPDNVED